MNPIILHELGKSRQREILAQARHHHTVAEVEAGRPGRLPQLLARVGGLLVAVGSFLQRQAERDVGAGLGRPELGGSDLRT